MSATVGEMSATMVECLQQWGKCPQQSEIHVILLDPTTYEKRGVSYVHFCKLMFAYNFITRHISGGSSLDCFFLLINLRCLTAGHRTILYLSLTFYISYLEERCELIQTINICFLSQVTSESTSKNI